MMLNEQDAEVFERYEEAVRKLSQYERAIEEQRGVTRRAETEKQLDGARLLLEQLEFEHSEAIEESDVAMKALKALLASVSEAAPRRRPRDKVMKMTPKLMATLAAMYEGGALGVSRSILAYRLGIRLRALDARVARLLKLKYLERAGWGILKLTEEGFNTLVNPLKVVGQ